MRDKQWFYPLRLTNLVNEKLKTITLRLQGMSDEGEEDLELMSKMEALFNKLGKTVYKTDGSLKNTYELLGELADVYPDLTAAEKAYVTETIAGKYQAQNAAAILSNWKTAVEATTTALNSQGSAVTENAKVLDSIQGKLASFRAAFEQLARSFIDSDFVKYIIDLGTALLKVANSDTVKFIAKATALFLVLNQGRKIWDALTKAIKANAFANNDIVKSIVYLAKGARGLNSYLNKNVESYKNLTAAEKAAVVEQQKVNAEMLAANLKAAALAVAITFLISKLDEYSERQKKLYQDQLDLESEKADKALTNSSTLEDDNATLEEQINKYKELKKSLTEEKHTLSEQITLKGQIYDIQKSIVDKYGEQASGLDLVNGKLDTEIEKLTEIERINAKTYLEENSAAIASSESALTRDYYSGNKQSGDWLTIQLKSFKRASQVGKAIAADLYGEYIEGFSDFVGNIFTQYEDYAFKFSGTAEEVRESLERSLELLNNETWMSQFDLTEDEIKATKTAIEKEISEIDEFIKKHQEVLNKAAQARALTEEKYRGEYGKFLEAEKTYAKAVADGDEESIKKAEEDITAFQTFVEGITDDPIMKNFFLNLLDGWKEQLQNSKIDEQIQNTTWKIEAALQHLSGLNLNADALRNLAKIYSSGDWDLNAYGEETYNAIWEIAKAANAAGVDLETFINRLETLGLIQPGVAKATKDAKNAITELSGEIETLKEEIDTLSDVYGTLESALSEYNENGYITLDTLMSLLDLEPKYLKYLFDENGRIKNNIDGLNDLAQARIQEIKAKAIQTAYEEMAIVIANNDADAIDKLKEKYGLLEGQLKDTGTAYEELAKDAAKYKAIEGISDENKNLIDAIVQNVENQFTAIDKLWNKTLSSGSKSSSSSKTTKEWWETALEDLKNQFKYNEITIEEYIKGLGTLLGQVEEGTDAWRQINEEFQKQRLSKVEDDYKRGTIGLEEYIKKLKELIKAYRQGTDAWNELADKIKSALQDLAEEQEDALETAKDAATTIIDEEIDRLKALQEAEEERYDKLIAEKEKANEETERELELAKLQEALENAKKEKTKRVWHEGSGWIWESDQEAIREAQEALDEFNRESEIEELEKQKEEASKIYDDQIDALEKYKDAWDDVANDYEQQQARITLAQQLGTEAEKNLLGDRITYLEEYKKKYLDTMKEIARLEETSSIEVAKNALATGGASTSGDAGGTDASSGTTTAAPSLEKGSYVSIKAGSKWYANSYGGGASGSAHSGTIKYVNSKGSHPYNIDGLGWVKKSDIVGYRDGGMVDYTGLAMLHGTKSKPEFVLNNDQMKNMLSNFTKPQTTSNISSSSSAVTNYNFGNIELPNVGNVQQFVTELKSLVNITKHQ